MNFLPLAVADKMGFEEIETFLEGQSTNNDARRTLWDTLLHPFFRDKNKRDARYIVATVWVPYGSNPRAPISDIGNAIGYIMCTAALEQRGNTLSTPIFEWAKELAASYAVILITLFKKSKEGVIPSTVHILWTESQNIELHAELPAGSPVPDIYQAMGSAIPGLGIFKKKARELRANAVFEELRRLGYPEAKGLAKSNQEEGHNRPGSCAEVLPFLSIITAVPPRPENRIPVFAFALRLELIEQRTTQEIRKASDIHRHGFVDACETCKDLMKSLSVNYIETRPIEDDFFDIEALRSANTHALVLHSNGDNLWCTCPDSEEANRNTLRDLSPESLPETILPNKMVALSTDEVLFHWDNAEALAAFVTAWTTRPETLRNITLHHVRPDAPRPWLSSGLLAGGSVAVTALGLLATLVMNL